jgi:hypothetical protein
MAGRFLFSIYVIYCFEVGLFLIVFPWMEFWKQNFLLYEYPALRILFLNDFFRGAISGLGIANIILGTWEIAHFRHYFKKS